MRSERTFSIINRQLITSNKYVHEQDSLDPQQEKYGRI
jgi:hypothetical protein